MAHNTNDGKHLARIMDMTACEKHKAPLGIPCFHVRKGKGVGYYPAICNKRAVKYGASGKISESSYLPKNQRSKPYNKKETNR